MVEAIYTRFIERLTAASGDVTRPGSNAGSQFYVDTEQRILYLAGSHSEMHGEDSHRRDFCHLTDIPSPSILKHLLKVEGGAAE